ncbi:MAG: tRNA (N(6)-L-threonylcarbamoyladenosine(37)-C(2))-methylthiotransferase MtaB [Rhodobiaceae bacterium]|nr:tRNA (N(6)-L-threonylcarbamoyladenosine(37)-C(2))-methylthiotransferase MtaB [Rhodobiaceae bacterium]MCC0041267.1 tRNA (N(6)-L-threonylcarbamoyladenosine(37)-C(2))-methylthiotransferase MtaB [Rhodobiaceae bacterium]
MARERRPRHHDRPGHLRLRKHDPREPVAGDRGMTCEHDTTAGPRVLTFGCRLNAYESELIRSAGETAGADAATIVVNTCAVTGEAVRQARQAIRRARRENPHARIIVTGCAAQTEPATFAGMDEVDLVIGNAEKADPSRYAPDFGAASDAKIFVNDIMSVRETAGHLVGNGKAVLIDGLKDRARAFVQVQNGCDHRCTFCIIPYGRGPSRSVPAGVVVEQVRRLVENGYAEVVLTGVDLTSWGDDLPGTPRLGRLVKDILRHVPELKRLRISSIDSIEVDELLMDAIATEARLMPHLHLSLQAGDDLILKRMKRRHLRAEAIRFCEDARKARPDMVFGADLIAGFPTETEEHFQRSLDIVGECGLTHLHVFPFSAREGTPAARMPQLPRDLVKERAARLREAGDAALRRHLDARVGSPATILVERPGIGRTEQFTEARFAEDAGLPGALVPAVLSGHDGRMFIASTRAAA